LEALTILGQAWTAADSELVQQKLNIEYSDGDSNPPEVDEGPTSTYRSRGLDDWIKKEF